MSFFHVWDCLHIQLLIPDSVKNLLHSDKYLCLVSRSTCGSETCHQAPLSRCNSSEVKRMDWMSEHIIFRSPFKSMVVLLILFIYVLDKSQEFDFLITERDGLCSPKWGQGWNFCSCGIIWEYCFWGLNKFCHVFTSNSNIRLELDHKNCMSHFFSFYIIENHCKLHIR